MSRMIGIFHRNFYLILGFIFLAELLSLFGYLLPVFKQAAFFIICALALILSLYNLKYGVWLILAELFIGSKGYLFFFEQAGLVISIRIALWLIVMAVWLAQVIERIIKGESVIKEIRLFFRQKYFSYFFILFIFIAWGAASGLLNNNQFSNIFFDLNGWLYFSLIFPFYTVIKSGRAKDRRPAIADKQSADNNNSAIEIIYQIFIAALGWLGFKTLLLLFLFSRNIPALTEPLYRWVRTSGVGEITQLQGGFYRIFFQSHIFLLTGLFIFLLLFTANRLSRTKADLLTNRLNIILFSFICLLLTTIIISFSRSFWLGLAAGAAIYELILIFIYKTSLKQFILTNLSLILAAVASLAIVMAIVQFPWPRPLGGFSTTELLQERASQISGEAGVSSRWALLPPLWQKIKQSPILGQGFGSTVTYISSDPRILQSNPTGEHETYAFEWGWLDIWLKLGLLGLAAYLLLLFKIIHWSYRSLTTAASPNKAWLAYGLMISIIVMAAVNIFTPYLNHPLGIGYIILAGLILAKTDHQRSSLAVRAGSPDPQGRTDDVR